jgi:hypothetical protein
MFVDAARLVTNFDVIANNNPEIIPVKPDVVFPKNI